ncbi:MAG: PqqD family protein [Spirochaetota bacterium]
MLLLVFPHGTEQLLSYTRESDTEQALLALADSILRSPNAEALSNATLRIRVDPLPMLVVFGEFDRTSHVRILRLAEQLRFVLAASRYVDWRALEEHVVRLADLLVDRFGADEVARFHFTAIPRGGMIVLGLLSYALGLSQSQVSAPRDPSLPLVVVDDCSLSGLRFREFLEESDARRIIFCPLFAHPELCCAIESAESRVVACFPGAELHDWARERYGDEYSAWRAHWEGLEVNRPYWQGRTDQIAFPWSEPQTVAWNPDIHDVEPGWELLPAHLCLKHRLTPRTSVAAPTQVVRPGPGPIRPADRAVWARLGDAVLVAPMPVVTHDSDASSGSPAGPVDCLRLEGSAADMWDAIVECGSVEAASERLLELYDAEPSLLRNDLANFVVSLQNDGILTDG